MKKNLTALSFLLATACTHAATVYVDFGLADTSGNVGGNYWNVWNPGNNIDLIDIDGSTDTGWNLISTTAATVNNRTTLDYVPSFATHGAPNPFNDDNIASDALFLQPGDGTRNIRLTTLDPSKTYNFQIYGAREGTSETRITNYSVVGLTTQSGTLTTTGTDVGTGGADYNNANILSINGIAPTAGGLITIEYSVNSGGFGYLNAFTVTQIPEPASALLCGCGLVGMLLQRRRRN